MAGHQAWRRLTALAAPADSRARREAMDSNSAWEARERVWALPPADAQPRQAGLTRVQEKSDVAAQLQALRAPPASRQQGAAAGLPVHAMAPAAWQQPGLAREKSSVPPRGAQPQASELEEAQEPLPQALLRRRSLRAERARPARKQLERVKEEWPQEAAGVAELPPRVSCEPLWRPLLSLLCPLPLFVRLLLRLGPARENVHAPLPRLPRRSNWNAFFSRSLPLRANSQ